MLLKSGVTPDIMTMAKATTNGVVPMGVVAVKEEMYDTVLDASKAPEGTPELFHGYTYSGIPVAVAAALAVQDIFDKEDIFKRAKEMSPYFQDGLTFSKRFKRSCKYKRIWNDGWHRDENGRKTGKSWISDFQTLLRCWSKF